MKCSVYSGQLMHGWVFSHGCVTLCMMPALIRGSETGTKRQNMLCKATDPPQLKECVLFGDVMSTVTAHPDFPQQLSNNVEGRYPCRCGKGSSSQTFNWTLQEQF